MLCRNEALDEGGGLNVNVAHIPEFLSFSMCLLSCVSGLLDSYKGVVVYFILR